MFYEFNTPLAANSSLVHIKGALCKKRCDEIIDVAKRIGFDNTSPEAVDGDPEFQINILSNGEVLHDTLWKYCKDIYYTYREPNERDAFMFLKRYKTNERKSIPPHRDEATYTVSLLLSDARDFEGCEFFLFDSDFSFDDMDTCTYIKTHENEIPLIDFNQGDVVRFDSSSYHGVTPLTKGERYLLTIFYTTNS
jgi:hypothetical protein